MIGLLAQLLPFLWQMALSLKDAAAATRTPAPVHHDDLHLASFGENIEIEAYLLWPALLVFGIHPPEMDQAT